MATKEHRKMAMKSGQKAAKNSRKKALKKWRKIAAKCLQIENLPVIRYFVEHRAAPHCKTILRFIVRCALSELQSCESCRHSGGVPYSPVRLMVVKLLYFT
ncbi:hypothetical protein TURU_108134 [Turdus rufiventris]|nr:hypothetical protein TURU_108134 [Turdus rufiventris]